MKQNFTFLKIIFTIIMLILSCNYGYSKKANVRTHIPNSSKNVMRVHRLIKAVTNSGKKD